MKRMITLLLAVMLVVSAFCLEAFAAPNVYSFSDYDAGTYKLKNWSASVSVSQSRTAVASLSWAGSGRVSVQACATYWDVQRKQNVPVSFGDIANGSVSDSYTTPSNVMRPIWKVTCTCKINGYVVTDLYAVN